MQTWISQCQGGFQTPLPTMDNFYFWHEMKPIVLTHHPTKYEVCGLSSLENHIFIFSVPLNEPMHENIQPLLVSRSHKFIVILY